MVSDSCQKFGATIRICLDRLRSLSIGHIPFEFKLPSLCFLRYLLFNCMDADNTLKSILAARQELELLARSENSAKASRHEEFFESFRRRRLPRAESKYVNTIDRHLFDDTFSNYVIPHQSLVDQLLVHDIHDSGHRILVWTVNDTEAMLRMANWGVDGIISDETERLVHTLT